ncbi:hypothetical protein [Luteolibacter sp. Populi]|uniref:hypothetical protein n=1 Tax=Luteolibacter sp. Populi TaxID=3230487 RepID=UPI00346523A0
MKSYLPTLLAVAFAVPVVSAETLLFSDNFDIGDAPNFDTSSQTGRRSGTLAADVFLRSAQFQHNITANQFKFGAPGRTRFENAAGWYNWASASSGPAILAAGGIRVSFDWIPLNTTTTNWISFDTGFQGSGAGEPGTRVVDVQTDYGFLFRNNGGTERWDNGTNRLAAGSFTPVATNRHVVIDYGFPSFANGTTVKVRISVNDVVLTGSTVGGVAVPYETFFWDNNDGTLHMELGANEGGHLIDNYSVSTIPAIFDVTTDQTVFSSGLAPNGLVANLVGSTFGNGPEASTFALVAGDGDIDNARFKINGSRIEPNSDFINDPNGAPYSIRVQATGTVSGGTQTKSLTLTLFNDDDLDGLLDDWELNFVENLTDLNGLGDGTGSGAGSGDFDNDGVLDLEEYNYSKGPYPDISPVLADTDGDTLNDADELAGAEFRGPTNPTLADTDKDGLSDLVETSLNTYISPTETGSNPVEPDSDTDGARDGYEVEKGTNPVSPTSRPALPAAFALVELTDDASSGIDSTKNYTHAISGGGAAEINGVTLSVLDNTPANIPPNFTWTVGQGNKGSIAGNNGDWDPALGNVTGEGLLQMLGSFAFGANGDAGLIQTYTLNGLVVGEPYELKFFIRKWDTEGSGRPNDLAFINGETTDIPFGGLLEDRPGIVLQNGNDNSAYYLRYNYVAQDTKLVIQAGPHISASVASGAFHLYGLTNEGPSGIPVVFAVTSVVRNVGNEVVIDFTGAPNTEYEVTKSGDLATAFASLVPPLMVTTNASGAGQVTVPAAAAAESKGFYRIEE